MTDKILFVEPPVLPEGQYLFSNLQKHLEQRGIKSRIMESPEWAGDPNDLFFSYYGKAIKTLIESYGSTAEPVTLCTASSGDMVCLEAAYREPELVDKLIFIDSSLHGVMTTQAVAEKKEWKSAIKMMNVIGAIGKVFPKLEKKMLAYSLQQYSKQGLAFRPGVAAKEMTQMDYKPDKAEQIAQEQFSQLTDIYQSHGAKGLSRRLEGWLYAMDGYDFGRAYAGRIEKMYALVAKENPNTIKIGLDNVIVLPDTDHMAMLDRPKTILDEITKIIQEEY